MQLRMSERVGPLEFNHWSATPGRNLIRLHLKWIINNYDLAMLTSPVQPQAAGRRRERRKEDDLLT